MAKERFTYLDAVSGLLIIWMIIGHCNQISEYYTIYILFGKYMAFFMPWFFYKSGMFFQERPIDRVRMMGGVN